MAWGYFVENIKAIVVGIIIGSAGPLYILFSQGKIIVGTLGDLGEWVGSLATFAAVVVSLKIATNSRLPHVQVVSVARMDYKAYNVWIYNDGPVPIYRADVYIRDAKNYYFDEFIDRREIREKIMPGQEKEIFFGYGESVDDESYKENPVILIRRWQRIEKAKRISVEVQVGPETYETTLKKH